MIKKNLKIISILSHSNLKKWQKISNKWEKYFNIDHIVYEEKQIGKLWNQKPDFLFLSEEVSKKFQYHFYTEFKKTNRHFKYVVVTNRNYDEKKDVFLFKNLVDDIISLKMTNNWVYWKTIAILRRKWDSFSNGSIIIYQDLIVDFVENRVIINGKNISLTSKELKLLRFFLLNKKQYISRSQIFKHVWGHDDIDNTRSVDQMFFKLKNKIGIKYFVTSRLKGFMLK